MKRTVSAQQLRSALWFGAIVCAVFLAYLPAFRAGFVFDDHYLIDRAALMRGPLWRIWFTSEAVDYLPVTWTSWWIEWRLWGGDATGFHVVNAALHGAAALLLWRFLARCRIRGAAIAALIFAVHPVAVESVAWISERKNTLSAVLMLGSGLLWLSDDEHPSLGGHLLSIALFLLALLAKASVVVFPVVMLGVCVARHGTLTRRHVLRALPYLILSVLASVATVYLQVDHAILEEPAAARTVAERLWGAGWAIGAYLWNGYVPVALRFVYAPWPIPPSSPLFWIPLLVEAACAIILWRIRRTWLKPVAWALAFHVVAVAPVLGLFDMSYFRIAPVANHLQYIALAGPAALFGYVVSGGDRPFRSVAALMGSIVIVAALGATTFYRSTAFRDDLTLWNRAVRENPSSAFAHSQLAAALDEAGKTEEGLAEFHTSARLEGDPAQAHRRLGIYWGFMGRPDLAVAELRLAASLRPESNPIRRELATHLARAGSTQEGIALLTSMLTGDESNRHTVHVAIAQIYLGAGQPEAAMAHLSEASTLWPGDPPAEDLLARLLIRRGDMANARVHVARYLQCETADPQVAEQLARLIREEAESATTVRQ